MSVGLGLGLVFVCLLRFFTFWVFFRFSLDYFVVLFALVTLGLVSSVLRQEIHWVELLLNGLLLCRVGCKTLTQSLLQI